MRWSVDVVDWDDPRAVRLREAQQAEVRSRYDGVDTEPGVKPSAADISLFLLVRDAFSGEPVGCGGLRDLADEAVEIKRMYVVPAHRGRGAGRAVLAALEQAARTRGAKVARLETGDQQQEAVILYERAGYHQIPLFGAYADSIHSICYEREL